MKTAILTAFNKEYADVYDVAMPLMKRYADKHGYGLHVSLYQTDPAKLKEWGDRGKIRLFQEHYADHDILCWMDIDVVLMNSEIRIEDVLGKSRPFLWTYDVNGPLSGFWIARCVPDVHLTLNAVAERAMHGGSVIPRVKSQVPFVVTLESEPYGTSDQTIMRELMNTPPYDRVLRHCVSGREAGHTYPYALYGWEKYGYVGDYREGDWLITFPSLPLEKRIEHMKDYASRAV